MAIVLLMILVLVVPATGDDGGRKKRAPEPAAVLARAWLFETADLTDVPAAADASIAVVPLADGKIVALEPATGNLLWTAEPGGAVSAPPLVTPEAVYVATSRTDEKETGVLRALDRATGLTLWARDLARPIVSRLVFSDGRIYCGSADQSVYALRADTGAPVWAFATRGAVRGHALVRGAELFVGSDDGSLYVLKLDSGAEIWRFQTSGSVVGRPSVGPRAMFVTSGDGCAYAVDLTTRRLLWKQRTGAAIEAGPVLVDDGVLVSSFDNFVYLLDVETGDRLWKRRMGRRLVSEPILDQGRAIVAPLRDSQLSVVALANGKKVGAFALDAGDELVAPPTFVPGGMLLVPTDAGLLAARPAVAK